MNYLNLALGAPTRLRILKNKAAKRNETYGFNDTWRAQRYSTFKRQSTTFNQGLNDNTPVWYGFERPTMRFKYCDESGAARIDHRGWYQDPDGITGCLRGFILYLPHGRFMVGYEDLECGNFTYFKDVYDDERTAAYAADSKAEQAAETAREYEERWREARDLEDKIETKTLRLRELLALRHKTSLDYVRSEIRHVLKVIRHSRVILATEYADAL